MAVQSGTIVKARAVRRIPVEKRWSDDSLTWVKHILWNRYKGDPNEVGEVPEAEVVDVPEEEAEHMKNNEEETREEIE